MSTDTGPDGTGNLEHVRFQLEQAGSQAMSNAMDAFEEHQDDPLSAMISLAYAAGVGYTLGRAWHGAGDGARSAEYHQRSEQLLKRANELRAEAGPHQHDE